MGLLVNASYVGIEFLDSTREQSLVIGTTDAVNAPGNAGLRFPDAQGNFQGYGKRWRPSANAAFQWKPSPELEIYADGLFQGFRSKDYNRWMFIPIFGGLTFSNVTTIPGTNQMASATVTGAVNPDGWTGSFNGKTDTYQAGGGLIWTKDRLRISADVAYTDSQFTADNVNVDYSTIGSSIRNVQFEAAHGACRRASSTPWGRSARRSGRRDTARRPGRRQRGSCRGDRVCDYPSAAVSRLRRGRW